MYIQRLLDMSVTTRGYTYDDIMAGKYGEPGAALMLFRTYPRIPFWEQVNDSDPFFTDYWPDERLLRHPRSHRIRREHHQPPRRAGRRRPTCPMSSSAAAASCAPTITASPKTRWAGRSAPCAILPSRGAGQRSTKNPLWEHGFHFYCLTPKTRHRVHSSWSTVDWTIILDSQLWRPVSGGQTAAGRGRPPAAHEPAGGQRPGH